MAIVTTDNQHYMDIAAAIRAKNGTDTQYTPAEMPAAIQAISGGGGSEPEPPDDGKTRLYIHVPENAMLGLPPPRADVPLYIAQTVSNGVSIDWGDDSEPETISGTGNAKTTHHYASVGDYVITLTVTDGCELGLGWGLSSYCVMGGTSDTGKVYCNMLQKAVIGIGVTSIGNYAFYYCYSLASIVIPDGVTSIGNYAFYYCYSLASVVIPDGVTSIGNYAFNDCYSLASVVIPDGVTSIGDRAFGYCYSLASVVIPDGVTSIGSQEFYYCYSLASIVIPDGVTSIGNYAFYYCYSLASVVIPDGVTSIGNYAFNACYSLASVVIPDSVTNIKDYAFGYCYGVKEYHILATTPPSIQSSTFKSIPSDCIIYVPAGTVDAYKTATNWVELADQIQEEPEA